jgi:hypothetical protein
MALIKQAVLARHPPADLFYDLLGGHVLAVFENLVEHGKQVGLEDDTVA